MIHKVIVFTLGEQRYGVPLALVERVIRAVEITPVPKPSPLLLGVVDVGGQVIPAFNVRRAMRLPDRDIDPDDMYIMARTTCRRIILVVDSVSGIAEYAEQDLTAAGRILPDLEFVEGVIRIADGIILIMDLDLFLSISEDYSQEDAMAS